MEKQFFVRAQGEPGNKATSDTNVVEITKPVHSKPEAFFASVIRGCVSLCQWMTYLSLETKSDTEC